MAAQPPIFLVGAERSGTTLLHLMLGHHPELAWGGEMEFLVAGMTDAGDWPALERYRALLAEHRVFRASGLEIDRALAFPELLRSFLEQARARQGKPRVGATVHQHFDRLLRVWPEARLIHALRDGRDVARSCVGRGWAGNPWTGAERWIEAERLWDRVRDRRAPDQYTEVRYEELVRRPRQTLEAVCEFLGVEFSPSMLEYPSDTSYGPPDAAGAEAWRRAPPDEVRLAEARLGDLLAARGYAPSGLPRLEIDAAAERRLRRQDRVARARFRVRRYGPLLVATELLTRRLGLGALHRRATRRMQDVATRQLQ